MASVEGGRPGAAAGSPPAGGTARAGSAAGRGSLEERLRGQRSKGRKLLVPYLTGGLGPDWVACLEAVAAAGADAVEVGLPFSDPMMDGPVIQRASVLALEAGATSLGIISAVGTADIGIPVAVMSYYNVVARTGHHRMARQLVEAGIAGTIVPDLPVDELDGWGDAAREAGVETVLLAAPTTLEARLKMIGEKTRGFLYAIGLMGVTGERDELSAERGGDSSALQAGDRLPRPRRDRHHDPRPGRRGRSCRRRRRGRFCSRPAAARGRRPRGRGGARG